MKPAALVIENDPGTRRLLDVLLHRSGVEADVETWPQERFVAIAGMLGAAIPMPSASRAPA